MSAPYTLTCQTIRATFFVALHHQIDIICLRLCIIALKYVDIFNPKSGRQTGGEKKKRSKKVNDNTVV